MYISDTNYTQAIDNLEDCMFALASMDHQIGSKNYATKEDLAYVEPRFTEAMRYIVSLNAHPKHQQEFREYLADQKVSGTKAYEALGQTTPYGSFIDHLAHFLNNIVHCPKKETP
tara:strand:+ start:1195 stop:1539 length:345 start_codon:yes stop_codon:yes gene_type:complete